MDIKKKKWIVFIVSVVVLIVGYVLSNPDLLGFCSNSDISCVNSLTSVGNPILIALIPISFISLVLLFVKDRVFHIWEKFAKWYIPLIFLIIWIIPTPSRGDYVTPDTFILSLFFFWLYALISLILIIYKTLKLKNKPHLEA